MENLLFKSYEYKNLRKQYLDLEEFHCLDLWDIHKKFRIQNKILKVITYLSILLVSHLLLFSLFY